MEKSNSVWILRLAKVEKYDIGADGINTAEFVFSSRNNLEKWLFTHGFVYGFHPDFVTTETPYWFHLKDTPGEQIEVWMEEKKLDDEVVPVWLVGR